MSAKADSLAGDTGGAADLRQRIGASSLLLQARMEKWEREPISPAISIASRLPHL